MSGSSSAQAILAAVAPPDVPLDGGSLSANRTGGVPLAICSSRGRGNYATGNLLHMGLGPLIDLPSWYWEVPYVGARFPGGVPRGQLHEGSNCQLWAYEVLDFFGFTIPDLRSDDLWFDTSATLCVEEPQPLDLVLFKGDDDPYGAHVGLWTGDAVAHLCKEVGHPVVWDEAEFSARDRYSVRIGFTRPTLRSPDLA